MTKLFIIGNGFDDAHGLPTKYSDFRDYMYENYAERQKYFFLPDTGLDHHGDIAFDQLESGKYLYHIIDASCTYDEHSPWQDFEKALGELKYNVAFDYSDFNEVLDDEGDIDEYKTAYNRENIGQRINFVCRFISEFMSEWISTIDVEKADKKKRFEKLAAGDDSLFLTFNYTLTLEKVYNIPENNICHIHGIAGSSVIVGHGLDDEEIGELGEKFMGDFMGAEHELEECVRFLKKDTEQAIDDNIEFFEELKNKDITEIYSYGFSFSNVDLPYIRKICEMVDAGNVTWYMHTYNKADYSDIIKSCGFKGRIEWFDC